MEQEQITREPAPKPIGQPGENVKLLTIDLPTELHIALKTKAAMMGLTMRELMIAVIQESLKEKPQGQ